MLEQGMCNGHVSICSVCYLFSDKTCKRQKSQIKLWNFQISNCMQCTCSMVLIIFQWFYFRFDKYIIFSIPNFVKRFYTWKCVVIRNMLTYDFLVSKCMFKTFIFPVKIEVYIYIFINIYWLDTCISPLFFFSHVFRNFVGRFPTNPWQFFRQWQFFAL